MSALGHNHVGVKGLPPQSLQWQRHHPLLSSRATVCNHIGWQQFQLEFVQRASSRHTEASYVCQHVRFTPESGHSSMRLGCQKVPKPEMKKAANCCGLF